MKSAVNKINIVEHHLVPFNSILQLQPLWGQGTKTTFKVVINHPKKALYEFKSYHTYQKSHVPTTYQIPWVYFTIYYNRDTFWSPHFGFKYLYQKILHLHSLGNILVIFDSLKPPYTMRKTSNFPASSIIQCWMKIMSNLKQRTNMKGSIVRIKNSWAEFRKSHEQPFMKTKSNPSSVSNQITCSPIILYPELNPKSQELN